MIDCTQKRSDGQRPVDRLLDGDLSPRELAVVEAHIESCEDCAETKQFLEATRNAWKDREDPVMPAALGSRVEDRLFAAIEAGKNTPQGSNHYPKTVPLPRRRHVFAAAAAAAVLLVAFYATTRFSTPPTVARSSGQTRTDNTTGDETGPESTLTATVMDISGGLASFERKGDAVKPVSKEQVLGLGEIITLGEGASVRFALGEFAVVALGDGAIAELVSQDGSRGIALKRGSAALKVDSDALDDIFKVVTPAGDVEVNGTVFYVRVSASSQVTVAVMESTVTIRDSANPRNVIPVHSGQEIDVDWSDPEVSPIGSGLKKEIHALLNPTAQGVLDAGAGETATRTERDRTKRDGVIKQYSRKGGATAEELFAKATDARKGGDVQKAARLYQRIIKSDAKRALRAEAAFNLGQLYFTTSKLEAAEEVLSANRALLERSSFRAMFSFYLAKTRCRLGKYKDGVRVINKFLDQTPNHSLADSMRKVKENCRE